MNAKTTLLSAVLLVMLTASSQATVFGGYDYYLTSTDLSWTAAEAEANAAGGYLASVHSAAENEFIRSNFATSGSVWLGLSDEASEGNFVWSDGSVIDYTNRKGGEPNNGCGGEDYVHMWGGAAGNWNDHNNVTLPGVIKVRTSVPDGGATALMLGASLLGFGAVRRKLK